MKIILLLACALLFLQSCIPLRIAPQIADYKLKKGNRFRKGLPKKTVYVFEDPKEAGDFYNYINTKFNLEDYYIDVEVPFNIDGVQYFFSFYEVEIPDKAINLFPLVFDVALNSALGNEEIEPYLMAYNDGMMRHGNWYIAIEVYNTLAKDCLAEDSVSRAILLPYLQGLKKEYLSTYNYNEIVFKN